ncbi:MAG: AAA family ATPase [Deltaproteobacteria bacterium]|nr:AAA family ATPase [Deltaproteobacteria bacterium]
MNDAALPPSAEAVQTHIEANFPLIYVVSWEEERVCEHLGLLCSLAFEPARSFVTWSSTEGFSDRSKGPDQAKGDPMGALDRIIADETPALYVLKDFHPYIHESRDIVRRLRDTHNALRDASRAVVILAPVIEVPPELVKDFVVIDYALPVGDEVHQIVEHEIWAHHHRTGQRVEVADRERLVFERMFLGLTREEIQRTLRKMLRVAPRIDLSLSDFITEEKRQILRKTEILEFIQPQDDLRAVGGLKNFKHWIEIREKGFSDAAREFGLPVPKGILLTGISGCGKSLAITSLARQWRLPLLRLDMGRVFAGIAGTPEQSLRRAILTAEAVAPSILWVDEIEMGISVFSDSVESGATSRNFASFLTWMQEKTAPVFIAATANDIDRLPPEFIRKGRFDEIFFVDLPEENERAEIFRIHLESESRTLRRRPLRISRKRRRATPVPRSSRFSCRRSTNVFPRTAASRSWTSTATSTAWCPSRSR